MSPSSFEHLNIYVKHAGMSFEYCKKDRVLTIQRVLDPQDHSINTSMHKEKHETTVKTKTI